MQALSAFAAELQRDGSRLVLVAFPSHLQVEPLRELLAAQGSATELAARARVDHSQRYLADRAALLDVPFLDLLGPLVEAHESPLHPDEPGHPGPNGYALMAREVFALLRSEGLLPR